jgi:hypothetical protein
MSTIEFNQENKPSVAELRQLLQDAEENYDPIEELLHLERQLAQLEQTHGLTSADFYRRYQAGKMGDDLTFITWAGRYRLYLRLKESISNSLKLVLADSPPLPLAA